MAKVQKMNGEGGTTEGMFFHRFSGTPVSQYEFRLSEDGTPSENDLDADDPRDYRKDVFVFEVRAELSKVISDSTNDGDRDVIVWKVLDSKPGKRVERGKKEHDPNQTTVDGGDPNEKPAGADHRGHGFGAGTGGEFKAGAAPKGETKVEDTTDAVVDPVPGGGGAGKVTNIFSDKAGGANG